MEREVYWNGKWQRVSAPGDPPVVVEELDVDVADAPAPEHPRAPEIPEA